MKRFLPLFLTVFLFGALGACGAASIGASVAGPTPTASRGTTANAASAAKTELTLARPEEDWAARYTAFVRDKEGVFDALWPDGMAGAGFIDLDLDGTPELVLFDMGASAAMGAQLFDLTEDGVICVSSTLEAAAGALGREDMSKLSVCASYFESFRLSFDGKAHFFWIDSANGTLESLWNELIRFGGGDGVLTLESVCGRYLQYDAQTGVIVDDAYTVGGRSADENAYARAEKNFTQAEDMGYDAKGVFVWSAADGAEYDDLPALVQAAADAYVPIVPTDAAEPVSPTAAR